MDRRPSAGESCCCWSRRARHPARAQPVASRIIGRSGAARASAACSAVPDVESPATGAIGCADVRAPDWNDPGHAGTPR